MADRTGAAARPLVNRACAHLWLPAVLAALAAPAVLAQCTWHGKPCPPNYPLVFACEGDGAESWAWCRTDLSVQQRVSMLVAAMTTEEKIAQLSTFSFTRSTHPVNRRHTPPIPRLGLPGYNYHTEGLHGVRGVANGTLFPQVTGMAATGNMTLVREMGVIMGVELRADYNVEQAKLRTAYAAGDRNASLPNKGHYLSIYGPTMNIIRDPRWGRAQESVSEDPHLNSVYAAAVVAGMQGDGKYARVAATCKHIAAYSLEAGPVDGRRVTRHTFQANVTAQEFQETFLPAFQACVQGGRPLQIMCAYNSVAVAGKYNSTPMCLNGDVLDRQLRRLWGFDGSVVSDCDAVSDAHDHHHWGPGVGDGGNASVLQVVAAGLEAGCDQDCGSYYSDHGVAAVQAGLLAPATLDRALGRILSMRFRLGEFDPADEVPYGALGAADVGTPASLARALQAARESIVLLNNSAALLPLPTAPARRVAVVGPLANFSLEMMGGKSDYDPAFIRTVLDGVRQHVGDGVAYVQGLPNDDATNTSQFGAAVAAARAADVVVAVVGIGGQAPDQNEYEGHDRHDIGLPGAQTQLVQALWQAVGPDRLVVVLLNGGPVSADWIRHNIPTVVEGFEGGQFGGDAVADVLFGAVAPAGVLPYTVYPADFVNTMPEALMSLREAGGKTYRFYTGTPLWPFGHSLSYTTWRMAWSSLPPPTVTAAAVARGGLNFGVSVTNVGPVGSAKVLLFFVQAQAFSRPADRGIVPPRMQLFALRKVHVQAGRNVTVTASSIGVPGFCGWCTAAADGAMEVRPGSYSVFVGDASGPAFEAALLTLR